MTFRLLSTSIQDRKISETPSCVVSCCFLTHFLLLLDRCELHLQCNTVSHDLVASYSADMYSWPNVLANLCVTDLLVLETLKAFLLMHNPTLNSCSAFQSSGSKMPETNNLYTRRFALLMPAWQADAFPALYQSRLRGATTFKDN